MATPSQLVMAQAATENSESSPDSLVMAWATDSETGAPVYILALDKSRATSKCRCICPSCSLPLTAVNVGKIKYQRRPHFRHPKGAAKSECMFLSARLAALHLLQRSGYLQLPSRKIPGTATGLSGQVYEAWVERPAEKVYFTKFDFKDHATALLTLADGRELRVHLIGTGASTGEMSVGGNGPGIVPTIILKIDDPALAGMSPDELLSRVTLLPDSSCWLSHWDDADLQRSAQQAAILEADKYIDWLDEGSALLELDPEMRRESLLHYEVKKIISQASVIRTPGLNVSESQKARNGATVRRTLNSPDKDVKYWDVQLERSLGIITPDVFATVAPEDGGSLLIEVTVSNRITPERLQRIIQCNLPTMEIDLSATGGHITRTELADWTLHGLTLKKWLHHPELIVQQQRLSDQVAIEVRKLDESERPISSAKSHYDGLSLDRILSDYLEVSRCLAELDADMNIGPELSSATSATREELRTLSMVLVDRGYLEAIDDELACIGYQGIVPRILAIKNGGGVGYRVSNRMALMNAFKQIGGAGRKYIAYYLMAQRVYGRNDPPSPAWFTEWVDYVRSRIASSDLDYMRTGKFDRLIGLLFPELLRGLATGFGVLPEPAQKTDIRGKFNPEDVLAVKRMYHQGAYRHYAPVVDFDQILRDAQHIRNQDDFATLYRQWSDRYLLRNEIHPIATLLRASGYHGAMSAWHDYNHALQGKPESKVANRYQDPMPPIRPSNSPPTPSGPSYADLKGRVKPRSPI